MGTDDGGVLEAARAIRPYLTDLVGQDAAGLLDRQIAGHLTGGSGRSETAGRLRALLEEQEDTRWFLTEVLADVPHHRPPYQQPRYLRRQTGGIASPAGDPGPILHTGIYTCPDGDYVWYRPEVGTPIPDCPNPRHGPLTRT